MLTKHGPREVVEDLDRDIRSTGGATVTVVTPFTGDTLHELPTSSPQDVTTAADEARLAQLSWQRAGFAHRRAILLKAHDLILERRGLLLDLLQAETGKTRGHAFEELFQAANATRYYALSLQHVLASRRRRAGIPVVMQTRVTYSPKGLVGIITPWNFPLSLAAMDVVPALAAGNAVLQKADNQCALTVLALRRVFLDAGVPPELWAVVTGDGAVIGNAVNDASDYICFTGSTPTGTQVGVRAASALRGASLELGGKNPLIILDDANPAAAAKQAVYSCFSSLGQMCVSIERIYVHAAVAERFTAEFVSRTKQLTMGAAFDYTTDVGSLTLPSQLTRVQAHVDDALAKGATLLAGGKARPDLGPLFYEPTVLTGVTDTMDCFGAETFGPVVAIHVVDSVEDAVLSANASMFGLNASIFSGSRRRARALAGSIEAGSVNINEGYRASFSSVDAPMGGRKRSGIGRRNGPEGLLRFVDAQTVSESAGLLALPTSGSEFARFSGAMLLLLRTLKAIRRR